MNDDPSTSIIFKLPAGTYHVFNGTSFDEVTAEEVNGLPEVITQNPSENIIYKVTSESLYYKWNGSEFDLVDVVEVSGLPEVISSDPATNTIYKVISANTYHIYNGEDFEEVEVTEYHGLPEVITEDPDPNVAYELTAQDGDKPAGSIWQFDPETREYIRLDE